MRRWISVLLVLFFGLWPLTGALEASDESRVPACCRRHGAHHCAMTSRVAAMMANAESGATPLLNTPMSCPLFPGFLAGPSTPAQALVTSVAGLPVLPVHAHGLVASRTDARMQLARAHAGRGPPALTLI
jgi:hypothetical protein